MGTTETANAWQVAGNFKLARAIVMNVLMSQQKRVVLLLLLTSPTVLINMLHRLGLMEFLCLCSFTVHADIQTPDWS